MFTYVCPIDDAVLVIGFKRAARRIYPLAQMILWSRFNYPPPTWLQQQLGSGWIV